MDVASSTGISAVQTELSDASCTGRILEPGPLLRIKSNNENGEI